MMTSSVETYRREALAAQRRVEGAAYAIAAWLAMNPHECPPLLVPDLEYFQAMQRAEMKADDAFHEALAAARGQ